MSHVSQTSRLEILRDRARQLAAVRTFFAKRNVCEVDTPLLSRGAALDAHIDLFATEESADTLRYLHSSPEFAMKRLLADGLGDIYQLAHVYRFGELSHKHQPEFTMLEWYRVGMSFNAFMDETLELLRVILGPLPKQHLTYAEGLKRYTNLDLFGSSNEELMQFLKDKGVKSYSEQNANSMNHRDDLLNQILGLFIEPNLGWESDSPTLTIFSHYPASQAALARTTMQEGNVVAERFEVYCQGLELANGYHELADYNEQKQRFEETNQLRIALGKKDLPVDAFFLDALKKGLPDSCGVAVGFDRLMMLRHKVDSITSVIPFSWDNI